MHGHMLARVKYRVLSRQPIPYLSNRQAPNIVGHINLHTPQHSRDVSAKSSDVTGRQCILPLAWRLSARLSGMFCDDITSLACD